MFSWLKKFKYKTVRIQEIVWTDKGAVYHRISVIFKQNGFGKRKAVYSKNDCPLSKLLAWEVYKIDQSRH